MKDCLFARERGIILHVVYRPGARLISFILPDRVPGCNIAPTNPMAPSCPSTLARLGVAQLAALRHRGFRRFGRPRCFRQPPMGDLVVVGATRADGFSA